MSKRKNLVAGVLIGGASRRMGRPKALIAIDGTTILERTVRIAGSFADRVVLLGHAPFEIPVPVSNLLCLPDRPGGVGPIGGLCALLENAESSNALLLSCDLP